MTEDEKKQLKEKLYNLSDMQLEHCMANIREKIAEARLAGESTDKLDEVYTVYVMEEYDRANAG